MSDAEPMTTLTDWLAEHHEQETGKVLHLDKEGLQAVTVELERLVVADDAEIPAMRERIARYGAAARPVVVQRLEESQTDRERERLLAVKYRLSAEDSLVLTWPGGLERLSDSDPQIRRRAADELVAMATAPLQPLLLELFADPDPSVREASLRGLKNSGGKRATEALLSLLDDPEPNVRAAVLKQFAEDATAELSTQVAEYSLQEENGDLVVHALRYFQELDKLSSDEVVGALVELGQHESWQVRAETAKTLGKALKGHSSGYGRSTETPPLKKILESLFSLLKDQDDFVVSRAVEALGEGDAAEIAGPLFDAAKQHPTLRPSIIGIVANGTMDASGLESLRGFSNDGDPSVRAAVVTALMHNDYDRTGPELGDWLTDDDSTVRTAAALAFFATLESSPEPEDDFGDDFGEAFEDVEPRGGGIGGFLKGLFRPKDDEGGDEGGDEDGGDEDGGDEDGGDAVAETDIDDDTDAGSSTLTDSETWLAEFRAGNGVPAWMPDLKPHFEAMLKAESATERNAAALAYLTYGHPEQSLPVLLETTKIDPTLIGQTQEALGWLMWSEKFVFFDRLYELSASDDDRYGLVQSIAADKDSRAKDVLWQILGRRTTSKTVSQVTVNQLRELYFGSSYNVDLESLTAEQRKTAHDESLSWADQPPANRQLAALTIAYPIAADEVSDRAAELSRDAKLDETIRTDLFLLSLAAKSKAERAAAAVSAFHDPLLPRIAGLSFLVFGDDYLSTLPNSGLRLNQGQDTFYSSSSGSDDPIASRIVVPESPDEVTADDVRPLLNEDPFTSAMAGYLLVLLGDASGMEPLLSYWRGLDDRSKVDRLVYRAIAIMDDDKYLSELKDIYSRLGEYQKRDFYWTIRIMTGPNLLELRAQIRDEVGMDNLR